MTIPLNKIVTLEFLKDIHGVLVHGCFDLLHIGHIRYIAKAMELKHRGEVLVATLTSDSFFPKHKGEKRPAFSEDIRAESLAALGNVDFVSIIYEPTAVLAIDTIKPRIYFKGWEAQGVIPHEIKATEAHGGKVLYMEKEGGGQLYSSGSILSGEYLRRL